MAVAFHSDSIEIQEEDDVDYDVDVANKTTEDDTDYVNDGTKTKAQQKPTQKSGRYKLIGLVVGLLCGVQALLNIGLRLTLYSEPINNLTNLDLQSRYDNLTKHLDIITAERDELKRMLFDSEEKKNLDKRRLCGPGWQTFGSGCYYISVEKKTWDESRLWCGDRQSDLIIINSKEEQDFVKSRNHHVWLGLTDREEEGVWKWVDGTPLISTLTYWYPGEPDSRGEEDCAGHFSGYRWFDGPCTDTYRWICEKIV